MKILIFSDIHYDLVNVKAALDANKNAEYALFLGDGLDMLERVSMNYPTVGFISVKGNCDIGLYEYPTEKTVKIAGIKIFMCHGHRLAIKNGFSTLINAASKEDAEIILFGHTHKPFKEEIVLPNGKKAVLFNPGSIGEPRGGSDSSYGVLEITEKDGGSTFSIQNATV